MLSTLNPNPSNAENKNDAVLAGAYGAVVHVFVHLYDQLLGCQYSELDIKKLEIDLKNYLEKTPKHDSTELAFSEDFQNTIKEANKPRNLAPRTAIPATSRIFFSYRPASKASFTNAFPTLLLNPSPTTKKSTPST